jgi:hypothetical protein
MEKRKIIDFFFKKKVFKRVLNGLVNSSTGNNHSVSNHNITGMLELLFPTTLPIKSNIHDSFREMILQMQTPVSVSSIIPDLNELLYGKNDDEFSYFQIGGAKYTAIKVTWVNDIINHPDYKKLLTLGNSTWEWWNGSDSDGNSLNSGEKERVMKTNKQKTEDFKKKWTEIKIKIGDGVKFKEEIKSIRPSSGYKYSNSLENIATKIRENLLNLFSPSSVTDNNIDNLLKHAYDVYDYDNEAKKISQQSSMLPYSLMREYRYDDLQNKAIDVKKSESVVKFFEDPHEYYEIFERKKNNEKSDVERKNNALKSEIQKYPRFMEFLKLAYSFLTTRKSSNPRLFNVIYDYLKSDKKSDKSENLAHFMNKVYKRYLDDDIKKSEFDADSLKILETGVDTIKSDSSNEKNDKNKSDHVSDRMYEIYIQLDVVKGILDSASFNKVKCMFRDSVAKKIYYSLKDKKENDVELDKKRFYLDLDEMKQESLNKEKSQESKTKPPVDDKIKNVTHKKGGKRKTRKYVSKLRKTIRKI